MCIWGNFRRAPNTSIGESTECGFEITQNVFGRTRRALNSLCGNKPYIILIKSYFDNLLFVPVSFIPVGEIE